jgi:hypothetical protein
MAMEKDELERYSGILLLVLSTFIIVFLVVLQYQTVFEAGAELAFIAVGTLATVGLKLLFFPEKSQLEKSALYYWTDAQLIKSAIGKDMTPDTADLSYLNIHYSKKGDSADKPHVPYYVVNNKTMKAYWVKTELLVLNKRSIIHANTHHDERNLKNYLKENKIYLVDRNPNFGELS